MPVYLHLASLILDKAAVASKYTGEVEQFRLDYKIGGDSYYQQFDELFNITSLNNEMYKFA
jgi:hypothetical protein